ncbi:MAG TPA: hypothetical protein VF399_09845 [bacterium]
MLDIDGIIKTQKFSGQFADVRADASLYSHEDAASLYVQHPEGLPHLERNTLIVGPLGSGKTIMLKTLFTNLSSKPNVIPVFVDTLRWTSQIAGETETYRSERLSPRGMVMLDAMALAIVIGLCESVGAFQSPNQFHSTWSLFSEAFRTTEPNEIRSMSRKRIKDALKNGLQLPESLPTVFTVANALGNDIRKEKNALLVLLVDQIDQVSSNFFLPIASLLRRSSHYVSILATRPCPTAPEPEAISADITSGDSYRIIQLGRSATGETPTGFVHQFVQALPLIEPYKSEIEDRTQLIANLMWPSLRFAISTIHEYIRLRSADKNPDESWFQSVHEVARSYEDIVQDGLRAWSANPKSMVKEWRRKVSAKRGRNSTSIGRSLLLFTKSDLFEDVKGKQAQHMIRVALKKGILLTGPTEHYVPGVIPSVCEIAPLLLVNDPNIDISRFDPNPVELEITEETLDKWSKPFSRTTRSAKRIFISYWMSDPEKTEHVSLGDLITTKFGGSIEVATGVLTGSSRWSPAIMEKISPVDLVLCDLSVPRRDIIVEYGVAIGTHIPVIQCLADNTKAFGLPKWITNRQFQFFSGTEEQLYRLETSIAALLENNPDAKSCWKRDSTGRNLETSPEPKLVIFIGPASALLLHERIKATTKESNLDLRFHQASFNLDNLEEMIKLVRSAGTLILAFDYTIDDYLACLGGGIFATKQIGYTANNKRYHRTMYLINMSNDKSSLVFPGLLESHPRSESCTNTSGLVSMISKRSRYILDVLKKTK